MDSNPEELQQLGTIGIFKEAYKTIFTWKKIFIQFTLVFIFPISASLLFFFHLSEVLVRKIYNDIYDFDDKYDYVASRTKWIIICFSTGAYLLVIITLYLLSTSAVVYIIGCIYTATEFSFKTCIIAVLKVCRRILGPHILPMVLHQTLALFFSMLYPMCIWNVFCASHKGPMLALPSLIILALSLNILTYIDDAILNFKWHLSCVVSIFEDKYGNLAIHKSSKLIDKFQATSFIVCTIQISELLLEVTYYMLIVHTSLGVKTKLCLGVVCFLLLSKTILFGFVIQSLLYFVCKSYLRENIDILVLKGRLEGYSNRVCPVEVGDGSAAAV